LRWRHMKIPRSEREIGMAIERASAKAAMFRRDGNLDDERRWLEAVDGWGVALARRKIMNEKMRGPKRTLRG
jgi:hypothetical protein